MQIEKPANTSEDDSSKALAGGSNLLRITRGSQPNFQLLLRVNNQVKEFGYFKGALSLSQVLSPVAE